MTFEKKKKRRMKKDSSIIKTPHGKEKTKTNKKQKLEHTSWNTSWPYTPICILFLFWWVCLQSS